MSNVSMFLLLAMAVVFILQLVTLQDPGAGITGLMIFAPSLALSEPWRFITSIFLHDPTDFTHILLNGYALFMFGTILESRVSARDFLVIFFGAGFVGGFLYYLTYLVGIIPPIPALGASGAIFGILGAVAMILPDLRIFMLFIPMRMREAAILWLILELVGTFNIASGIASAAHLGGLVFGLAYGWYLKNRAPPEPAASYRYPWQEEHP